MRTRSIWKPIVAHCGDTTMARFEGFADKGGRFFKQLARNNERAWFLEHKAEFEEGWNAPMKVLLAEVKGAIDSAYAHCDLGEPKVFRIFRDVRFSKDKSPYKTHIGGVIPLARSGKKVTDLPMALYFHVGAKETFGAAGHYRMEPDSLSRFRAAVADPARGKELEKILASLAKRGFTADSHEGFKRVPKGFAPDHPRAGLLKRRGLVVEFPPVTPALLTDAKLAKWLAGACKTASTLVEWLTFATA
jgi:uncharacterized protein (TIGR02453 family)